MNGLIGRRVEVVVVELGSDIYLCSEEKGLFFKQKVTFRIGQMESCL